eukprot:COSAG01_NODE_9661_length_2377_cov_1.574627_1_plen_442_part_10
MGGRGALVPAASSCGTCKVVIAGFLRGRGTTHAERGVDNTGVRRSRMHFQPRLPALPLVVLLLSLPGASAQEDGLRPEQNPCGENCPAEFGVPTCNCLCTAWENTGADLTPLAGRVVRSVDDRGYAYVIRVCGEVVKENVPAECRLDAGSQPSVVRYRSRSPVECETIGTVGNTVARSFADNTVDVIFPSDMRDPPVECQQDLRGSRTFVLVLTPADDDQGPGPVRAAASNYYRSDAPCDSYTASWPTTAIDGWDDRQHGQSLRVAPVAPVPVLETYTVDGCTTDQSYCGTYRRVDNTLCDGAPVYQSVDGGSVMFRTTAGENGPHDAGSTYWAITIADRLQDCFGDSAPVVSAVGTLPPIDGWDDRQHGQSLRVAPGSTTAMGSDVVGDGSTCEEINALYITGPFFAVLAVTATGFVRKAKAGTGSMPFGLPNMTSEQLSV